MDCVLRGLTWQTCLVYLDDIIIDSRGRIERQVVELAAVLERLSKANVSLNVKKCVFATTSIEYLGHQLGPDGIKPLDRLVTAVNHFRVPVNLVEVRRFVDLAEYYRRFVPSFSSILLPLTKLLWKTTVWR